MSRPIRKRAFHRALKRKEHWAITEDSMKDAIRYINAEMFKSILEQNPLLKMIGLKKGLG